jgi:prepilin-type N-terminal cleavage/methylation domain-containing protein
MSRQLGSRSNTMKLTSHYKQKTGRKGFTLIEVIGVLSVIAVLAALLTPKVFDVIARGKVNSTALAYNTVKTATTDYFAQNGVFPLRSGTGSNNAAVPDGRFDADLLAAGLLDKLFACSVGWQTNAPTALTSRTHVRALAVASAGTIATPTATVGGDNYNLDRDTTTADFNEGQTVVSVFIPGMGVSDAIALNKIIDGDENFGSGADIVGKCNYSAESNGVVTAYIYVAHY